MQGRDAFRIFFSAHLQGRVASTGSLESWNREVARGGAGVPREGPARSIHLHPSLDFVHDNDHDDDDDDDIVHMILCSILLIHTPTVGLDRRKKTLLILHRKTLILPRQDIKQHMHRPVCVNVPLLPSADYHPPCCALLQQDHDETLLNFSAHSLLTNLEPLHRSQQQSSEKGLPGHSWQANPASWCWYYYYYYLCESPPNGPPSISSSRCSHDRVIQAGQTYLPSVALPFPAVWSPARQLESLSCTLPDTPPYLFCHSACFSLMVSDRGCLSAAAEPVFVLRVWE